MTIKLFGVTKDIIGSPSLSLPTNVLTGKSSPKTVGELRQFLGKTYPGLKELSSLAIAVNNSYAQDAEEINSYDEIALIPPVSGG
ncbi:MAG: MoaD/ThiS family protein [Croceitalea sp.]|nr:MoaD/ThiS family protein [Croceitalea sp.]MBT8237545.1 MoaD/ThiS family protein [Croceitalea sp.]NNC35616.1 MoaD/ThiS family protein [Croceitalea sp.]NNL09529.1 MoaD/ThiS family protein [Croceitalea sp.]NNM18509.1 MoaD/ThiS family protein [Croceitalea sp.]